jgi:hypothetical protein
VDLRRRQRGALCRGRLDTVPLRARMASEGPLAFFGGKLGRRALAQGVKSDDEPDFFRLRPSRTQF